MQSEKNTTETLYSWDKSSEINNKEDVKKNFSSVKQSTSSVRFYRSLILTDAATSAHTTVSIGDGVFIASDEMSGHYIAKVELFFEAGDDWRTNTKSAIVTWFFKQSEIAQSRLPENSLPNEIFLCTAKVKKEIDAETIVGVCSINSIPCQKKDSWFLCRQSFDGRNFRLLEGLDEQSKGSENNTSTTRSRLKPKAPGVSVWSTLSSPKRKLPETSTPTKRRDCVLKDDPKYAVSACSVGRYDAKAAAFDLLDSDSDSELQPVQPKSTKRKNLKTKKLQKNSASDANKDASSSITEGVIAATKALQIDKNVLNVEPKSSSLSIVVKRLYKKQSCATPISEKENDDNVRKSCRLSQKKERESSNATTVMSTRKRSPMPLNGKSGRIKPEHHVDAEKPAIETQAEDISAGDSNRRSTRISIKKKGSTTRTRFQLARKALHLPPSEESDSDESSEDVDVKDKTAVFKLSTSSKSSDKEFEKPLKTRSSRHTSRKTTGKTPKRKSQSSRKRSDGISTAIKAPKNRKAFIPDRATPVKSASSVFDRACENLHVSAVPDSLPCREEQFQTIYSFIEGRISSASGGCLYISGVPGTGKTATVIEVLSCLRQSVDEGIIEDFDYVEVNGMRLTEPHQAYVSILKQLKGTKATPEHASQLLSKHFSMRGRKSTVLVVDELDLLWTKKQDVMYHVFDWPSYRHARLIVIAIANTMDLPERIMMNRVSSRLGLTRLSFSPYNYKQLQEIVNSRLRGIPAFDPDAIQLVSRKVAAVSGDARRCLDICRRSVEIAGKEERTKKSVKTTTIDHVHTALQEMFASPMILMIRNCSTHEKLFLRAIVSEFRRSGLEEATVGQVVEHHSMLAKIDGLPPCTVSSLLQVCSHLSASRIILLETGRHDIYARIRLNVSVDDVLFALNATTD